VCLLRTAVDAIRYVNEEQEEEEDAEVGMLDLD